MRFHLRRIGVLSAVIVLSIFLAMAPIHSAMAAPLAQNPSATTWTVLVGGQGDIQKTEIGPAGAWQFMRFYPGTITVNVGDTIVWKLNSAEPHTVTFPKPGEKGPELIIQDPGNSQRFLLNSLALMPQGGTSYDGTALTGSGQLGGDPQSPTEYRLTFTKEGTFDYVCAFHTMMLGKVIVHAAGSPYPKSQAQYNADAAAQLKADQAAAAKAAPSVSQAPTTAGPNGTTVYQVKMGAGDGTMSWMRFSPNNLTIHAGDTVKWVQGDVEAPHTVTFASGGPEPALVLPEPQQAGPPLLVANPRALNSAGGQTYSGKGYFSSGFLWGTMAPMPGPREYSLTFDTPGTYKYYCILHDMMGMQGTITVVAQGGPAAQATGSTAPGAQATSSASGTAAAPAASGTPSVLPVTGSSGGATPLWVAGAGLALLGAGLFLARRRSRAR